MRHIKTPYRPLHNCPTREKRWLFSLCEEITIYIAALTSAHLINLHRLEIFSSYIIRSKASESRLNSVGSRLGGGLEIRFGFCPPINYITPAVPCPLFCKYLGSAWMDGWMDRKIKNVPHGRGRIDLPMSRKQDLGVVASSLFNLERLSNIAKLTLQMNATGRPLTMQLIQ